MAGIDLRTFSKNKGQAFAETVNIVDDDGAAIDITGATIDLVAQYKESNEETDGTGGLWMLAAVNGAATGIAFSLTAAMTDALDVGTYTYFCNITYPARTEPLKVAEFTIEIREEAESQIPISRTAVVIRCGLEMEQIDERELDLAIKDAIAMTQSAIDDKIYQYCSENGYPQRVVTLAERYATLLMKGMLWPDKEDELADMFKDTRQMLQNVTIDTNQDKIDDSSSGASFDFNT